jgi:hypothetical protein
MSDLISNKLRVMRQKFSEFCDSGCMLDAAAVQKHCEELATMEKQAFGLENQPPVLDVMLKKLQRVERKQMLEQQVLDPGSKVLLFPIVPRSQAFHFRNGGDVA